MNVSRPTEADRAALARFTAPLQRRAEHHVAYLGTDPDSIAAEMLEDVDDWTEAAAIVTDPGATDAPILGWLMGSIDHDMGRVWWFGPFVDTDDLERWNATASLLDESARSRLGQHVVEEEYAFDARHVVGGAWAVARGFVADPGSAVLSLDHVIDPPSTPVRPATATDADEVARLHDELFPGTHTRGSTLLSGDPARPRLVVELDGRIAGYVAVERQPDGSGYVDYLGVGPGFRRRGLGAELVRAGVAALVTLGCSRFHLTVREANDGARALYRGLGFAEERVIRPYRRGFCLP